MKRKYTLGAILVIVLVVVLGYFYGGSQAPAGQAPLQILTTQNVTEVKNAFNAAKDEVRVLLLLSPT